MGSEAKYLLQIIVLDLVRAGKCFLANLWSKKLNIAKGTTDPRVEFISQDHSLQILNILQFQNLD